MMKPTIVYAWIPGVGGDKSYKLQFEGYLDSLSSQEFLIVNDSITIKNFEPDLKTVEQNVRTFLSRVLENLYNKVKLEELKGIDLSSQSFLLVNKYDETDKKNYTLFLVMSDMKSSDLKFIFIFKNSLTEIIKELIKFSIKFKKDDFNFNKIDCEFFTIIDEWLNNGLIKFEIQSVSTDNREKVFIYSYVASEILAEMYYIPIYLPKRKFYAATFLISKNTQDYEAIIEKIALDYLEKIGYYHQFIITLINKPFIVYFNFLNIKKTYNHITTGLEDLEYGKIFCQNFNVNNSNFYIQRFDLAKESLKYFSEQIENKLNFSVLSTLIPFLILFFGLDYISTEISIISFLLFALIILYLVSPLIASLIIIFIEDVFRSTNRLSYFFTKRQYSKLLKDL